VATLLSEGWLAAATERTRSLAPGPMPGDGRIQFVADGPGGAEWALIIAAGVIEAWRPGRVLDADVEIRWRAEDAGALLGGALSGTEATARTTMVEERLSGTYVGPPPPLDFVAAAADRLPALPGVDLRWQCRYVRGPFGAVDYALVFEDGQLVDAPLGVIDDADVSLGVPFSKAMLLRRGEITMLEALQDGRISGTEGSLAVLAGLLESPPYVEVMRECASGRGVLALAVLGEVASQDGYRRAMGELTQGGRL
jgi:hypothetical protein